MSEVFKIHNYWCEKQQKDYQEIIEKVDDLGQASLALASSGAQAYQQFIQAREDFKDALLAMTKNYRYVEQDQKFSIAA